MNKSYTHVIYLSSDYANGNRICLHFIAGEFIMHDVEKNIYGQKNASGVSLYTIETNSKTWDSVVAKDAFYKNVVVIGNVNPKDDDLEKFNNKRKGKINLVDISFLILSLFECNYIELVVYLYHCYCEYALKNGNLVDDARTKIRFDDESNGKISVDLNFGENTEIVSLPYPNNIDEFLKLCRYANRYKTKKSDVIASKFFNTENGAEIMNECIVILLKLRELNIVDLFNETIGPDSIYQKKESKQIYVSKYLIKDYYSSHLK